MTPLLFILVTVMIIASDLHDSGWLRLPAS
jgi:hypothetical protein